MDFDYSENVTDPEKLLESAVYMAIGAASTCWESLEYAGIFDSTRALEIGESLLKEIRRLRP